MARPIEPTPVLMGKDAERFIAEMNRVRTPKEIADNKKFLAECKRIHGQLLRNSHKDKNCPVFHLGCPTCKEYAEKYAKMRL
jgi:hypothetical protein